MTRFEELTVQDWLNAMLAVAEPEDLNMIAISALRSGIALEKVVCERHQVVDGWTGMARHLRESEIAWRDAHPEDGPHAALHRHGDLRPWTKADGPSVLPWEISRCRSCSSPIVWAITANGKRMPVDVEPTPTGNVVLIAPAEPTDPPSVIVLHTEAERDSIADDQIRTSHFATCPNADAHRRPR